MAGALTFTGLNIRPPLAEWNTTGDKIIILASSSGRPIFYVLDDGYVYASDGTNTCKSPFSYTANTDHDVSLMIGVSRMQLVMDDTKGDEAVFTGTFDPGPTLKYGFGAGDLFEVKDICGTTSASFDDLLLAQDLAFDL